MSTLEIKKVFFTDEMLSVELVDKRVIMTPLSWYEVLNKADEKNGCKPTKGLFSLSVLNQA